MKVSNLRPYVTPCVFGITLLIFVLISITDNSKTEIKQKFPSRNQIDGTFYREILIAGDFKYCQDEIISCITTIRELDIHITTALKTKGTLESELWNVYAKNLSTDKEIHELLNKTATIESPPESMFNFSTTPPDKCFSKFIFYYQAACKLLSLTCNDVLTDKLTCFKQIQMRITYVKRKIDATSKELKNLEAIKENIIENK